MRRKGGFYGGETGGGGGGGSHHMYGTGAQMHQQQQQQNVKSGYYPGRHSEQQPYGEKEDPSNQSQWRWERDGQPKLPQMAMSPAAPFAEGQGREPPRSYYESQRVDPRMSLEKHGGGDPRSQPQEEDMEIGYEDSRAAQTFEGLEQKFVDDIVKLSKEQNDAEDAEIARHRERINAINAQYEERLAALRARHASRREEFLRRESQARQQQYQRVVMEQYPEGGISPADPRGYNSGNAPPGEPHRAYNSNYYDSHRERGQFPGHGRDHGYEAKVPYPRGRGYDTGPRHY